VSRIFLSHSSANNSQAIAVRDWLKSHGWDDVFLDLDPERGIKAGERWQAALRQAAERCEVVIFLISPDWVASRWCLAEFLLAKSLNKRIFGAIVESTPFADLPPEMTVEWQLVDLTDGSREYRVMVTLPPGDRTATVAFSKDALDRLRFGLMQTGLDASYFDWPPRKDPDRPPYRGLSPLESDDAGIFCGREAPMIEALDRLRGLREAPAPRLLVILGASGAGKSSFLRAGLLPRLVRDNRHFLPLPIIRPERAVVTGQEGLLPALEGAVLGLKITATRAELRGAINGGIATLRPLLRELVEKATPIGTLDSLAQQGVTRPKAPTLVLSIDQGEELFLSEGQDEGQVFLALLRELLIDDAPPLIALLTIRSDSYERLQEAKLLEGVRKVPFDLGPMPKGSYSEVIRGPPGRLEGTTRAFEIEEALVDALLADVEAGTAKDALPLLAFTLERLYSEYHAGGQLKLAHYEELGRVKGSIEAAVERALQVADEDPKIPRDRLARLALLRHGLIPWLADIDPDTGTPRRRVARRSEIPIESRPLIDLLVAQRLLAADVTKETGEGTVEPVHEALLRQWGFLQCWLAEDAGLLSVVASVKRSSRDWAANGNKSAWLAHAADRLTSAERLRERPDLAANLGPIDWDYLAACRTAENVAHRRTRRAQALVGVLGLLVVAGVIGWVNQARLLEQWRWSMVVRPYLLAEVRPHVLAVEAERILKRGDPFKECARDCPVMVVVPAGRFVMGSPDSERGASDEGPQHNVEFARPFAVARDDVTFDDWDACVAYGDCPRAGDSSFGRGRQPVINVTWDDARRYTAWLSRMTGKPYRLLSEAEFEYAARAETQTAYPWGNEIGRNNADCSKCGSKWDRRQPSPVGSFPVNRFGLHDMHGDVLQWTEDCYHPNYQGAPQDGSAWVEGGDCTRRVTRGGSWMDHPQLLRSARRYGDLIDLRAFNTGFRIARTLLTP
jgi:formylglycine-generating enzyme required for sulfatase activity